MTNKTNLPFTSEQEIWRHFGETPTLYNHLSAMHSGWRQRLFDYMLGKKTLPITYDPFFKRIFNADIHPERLSHFLSAILGQEVTVSCILPREEVMLDGGALLIMDILVRLTDGSLANVEIQKMPYYFPGERISCYSADLLLREYSRVKGSAGKDFTYRDIKKVYAIVIFENTTSAFHDAKLEGEYFHYGKTVFHSQLKLDLLQEYYLIALDVFRDVTYSRDINELNGWLSLLAVENMDAVDKVIQTYPWLAKIYEEMAEYLHKPKEVLSMFSEALRILDQNTLNLMIDDMKEEIEAHKKELAVQQKAIESQKATLAEQKATLAEQNATLAEQKEALDLQRKELEQERSKNAQKEEEIIMQQAEIARLKQLLEAFGKVQ